MWYCFSELKEMLSMLVTSIHNCMKFLSRFQLFKFLMTMDYSPWSERENWPFLKVAVSPKPKRHHPLKLVYMYVTSNSTCMNFLSQFRSIKFYDDHGYSPWSERENWPFLKVAVSLKSERHCPPKLVCMLVTSIPTCMKFLIRFRLIKFFDDHGKKGKFWLFWKVAISPKPKRHRPPKLVCMYMTSITTCMNVLSQFR